MTRREFSNTRDLTFSGWIRKKLPDSSTGFCVSDLDFIIWNWKQKKVMLIEVKTSNSYPKKWQHIMWQKIHKWLKKGIDKDWKYYGFHLIVFEQTSFDDGLCYLDNKEISENDLIDFLSFKEPESFF